MVGLPRCSPGGALPVLSLSLCFVVDLRSLRPVADCMFGFIFIRTGCLNRGFVGFQYDDFTVPGSVLNTSAEASRLPRSRSSTAPLHRIFFQLPGSNFSHRTVAA